MKAILTVLMVLSFMPLVFAQKDGLEAVIQYREKVPGVSVKQIADDKIEVREVVADYVRVYSRDELVQDIANIDRAIEEVQNQLNSLNKRKDELMSGLEQ